MADLTEETAVTAEDLKTWYELKAELARVKGAEAMLRSRIFKHYFPNPTEGSKDNKVPLNDGTGAILQADHVINRTVDEQQLEALREAMFAEGSNLPKLDLPKLIRWKPELVKSEYTKLSEDERHTLDQALIIKPGSPQMEIKIPKRPA
jgi:hypothetical protein